MKLKLDNPKILADIITIISDIVTEVRLKVNPEGMAMTAFDPANVAMVFFSLPKDLFSEFELEKEEDLGINLDNFKAILRRCKPGAALTLERADNMLKLGIEDRVKRDFSLALVDVDIEDKELPEWDFTSVVKMNSDSFVEVIEDCEVVSDACTFTATPDKFIVEAAGLNSARAEFSSDEIEIHSANSTARYSLEYLKKFIKGAKVSSQVAINFSDGHPLRINFPTGNVMLSFVLAPRIEQED
ncbi:proliferating cell nuclear antigen (pcna) [Candidatus Pacearchaeota archaeon]|jgi:proliferating cell nuclear antigen PCNA|nr:proliferating cell nuclear antigen (pcna) [Candidatus Pacearchaeota archaeon]